MLERFRRWMGNYLNGLSDVAPCSLALQKVGNMKNILIISETNTPEQDSALDKVRHNIASLAPNATISALCLYRKDSKAPARISAGNILYICQNDFSFFYKFNSEDLKNTLKKEYDLVLVSSISENKYVSYILPYTRTVLKVGLKSVYNELVNIMIDSNSKSIDTYNKEALANIKMLFGQN